MEPTASVFLSFSPVSGPAFAPFGSLIAASRQSALLTAILFVAVFIVLIASMTPRAFSVN